jgi:hypothetical protein
MYQVARWRKVGERGEKVWGNCNTFTWPGTGRGDRTPHAEGANVEMAPPQKTKRGNSTLLTRHHAILDGGREIYAVGEEITAMSRMELGVTQVWGRHHIFGMMTAYTQQTLGILSTSHHRSVPSDLPRTGFNSRSSVLRAG